MFCKILFRKVQGGAILLLPLLIFLLMSTTAFGQDPDCEDASCSSLRVEVVRHGNVTPDCPIVPGVCNDGFSQIAYTVYLRRSKNVAANDPLLPYNLEYDLLDVSVSLANPNNLNLFSHIDVDATQTCFENGVGAKWNYNTMDGNKVIFTPTAQDVTISFANLAPGSGDCGNTTINNTSNIITFTYTPPPGLVDICGQAGFPSVRCAYAELFTVIVNAYPGEQNSLKFDTKRYLLDFGSPDCTIEQVNTGPNNGLSSIQVVNPTHFAGTVNENILAQLLPPVVSGPGERTIPVQIRNTGGANITVDYLEFMVRGLTTNITEPFEYTLATPRTSVTGGGAGPVVHNLHYRIPDVNVTLAPNATHVVGNIIVKTPALSNLSWAFNFAFQDSGVNPSKSRIKTTNACTSLSASVVTSSGSNIGDASCADPSVHFKVEGEGASCTTTKAVNVGLLSTLPPASIRLSKVEFELEFSWLAGAGVTITGVDFFDWAFINCATFGCYTNPLGQKECWQVTPNSTGAIFRYCYETNDANAPIFSLNPLANMKIMFNTPNGSVVENAVIRTLRISYVGSGGTPCIPVIDPIVGFPTAGSSPNQLTGTIETETNQGVEEVTVTLSEANSSAGLGLPACPNVSCSASCIETKLTNSAGIYLYCDGCPSCNFVKVTPEKDDNPLNGVTTFDLVLISKHILGLEPLNSPYKMIAADANKSGSITTFDIVEFRKLILGIYPDLPANTSWRFVDKSFTFPNQNNPFETTFPEAINCVSFPSSGHDFVGIKVGDLNGTAVPRPVIRPSVNLSWPQSRAVSGATITVPITYSGSEPIEAVQLGIRFDSSQLQLIGPSVGDIETYLPENFNLLRASEGEIKTLWLPMNPEAGVIQPGAVLFNLTFKVLENLPETGLPLWLDEQLLDCAAWKPDGTEYTLQQSPVLSKRDDASAVVVPGLTAFIAPNPSSGSVTLTVQSLQAEKSRLALFDAFGQRLWMREIMLEAGQQTISMPEVAPLPSGVYVWKLYTPLQEVQGHLIKQ